MPTYANVPAKNRKGKQPKIFVLDTNIILHDYKAIGKFQDNDVVLPIAPSVITPGASCEASTS